MRTALVLTLVAALAAPPAAADTPPQAPTDGQSVPAAQAAPSPEALGLSLRRIRRELRETPPTKSDLLRYDFHVDVYGQRPKLDFFENFDLNPRGAVQYGGMTHNEFLEVVTPKTFRAPGGDLLGLAVFALGQLAKKTAGSSGSGKNKK